MRQQQCIDSINAYIKKSKNLFQQVRHSKDSLRSYDLQSYEKWLPTLNEINEKCWAAHWLRVQNNIPDSCIGPLDKDWATYRDYVNDLYTKEVDNIETSTAPGKEALREEGEKRIEVLEKCGLLYPE